MSGVARSPVLLVAAALAAAWAVYDGVTLLAVMTRFNSDYVQDYLSARALGRGESIYVPVHPPTSHVPEHPEPYENDHPPTYVLFLAPLSGLRYDLAFLTLGLLSLASAALVAWLVAREVGAPVPLRMAVVAALLWHPGVTAALWAGNASLLIALMVTLAWASARRGADGWAGFWVGLAAAVKLFPGLLILVFLVTRRWRSLGAAIATGAAYLVLTVSLTGFDDALHYARDRAPVNARAYAGHGFNLSLAGVAHRTFGEPSPLSPWLGRVVVRPELAKSLALFAQGIVGVFAVLALLRRPREQRTADRSFALLVPAMLLLSPLTWLHIVPVMLLPVAILARDTWLTNRRGLLPALAACAALLCVDDRALAIRLLELTQAEVLPWWGNALLLAPTWGTLGVLGLAAVNAASSSAASSLPTSPRGGA
jgi:hypothetical protein